jgi:tRNA-dihydrouridine synthase
MNETPPHSRPAALFDALLKSSSPLLALAPMQDVTDLAFWRLMATYGGPDVYWTEYFRVHGTSSLDRDILRSITENPTGRPAVAQLIGNDVDALVGAARELQRYPIAAVDLNLGCPAPIVYRKCAGGGLLREPERVDAILGALRECVGVNGVKFTVKTRIGFDDPGVFDQLLAIFGRHSLDLLTVHGRTVTEMYRSEVHYDFIARAVEAMSCPVIANGNIHSPAKAEEVLRLTGAQGLMIGRGAIRNPWLFNQIRARRRGDTPFVPRGRDVLGYIDALYHATEPPGSVERLQVQKLKKYLNFIGLGVDSDGRFLHDIRRVSTKADFFAVCTAFLDHDGPMLLEPYALELKETDVMAGAHL